MNGGRSSCQCVHLSFLDGWSIFTFIYEILFPASWKANVWISCSWVMSFSFDLGLFSGVWFLVSSLPFRFGQLFFIDILFFAPRWVFCSVCTLEPHVSSRLKYLWAINSFFEATLMARGEKLLSFEVPFSFISPILFRSVTLVSLMFLCMALVYAIFPREVLIIFAKVHFICLILR